MSKVAIVYWSGTGNTEAMADLIAQGVRAAGGTADLVHAADFTAERVEDYDALAFGCPAMGDEELEDMEFLPMYDQVEPHLAGHKVVLFGSYEWNDGEWMELWEKRAEEAGVDVADSVIAYDYPDDEASAECPGRAPAARPGPPARYARAASPSSIAAVRARPFPIPRHVRTMRATAISASKPSVIAQASHTPWMPRPPRFGTISTSGTNSSNGRASASSAAKPPFPNDWNSVMPITMTPIAR